MSKKKRKTRAEKEVIPKHNFAKPVYRFSEKTVTTENIAGRDIKPSGIETSNILDIKKVAVLVVVTVVVLAALAYLTYQTDIFKGFFSRFNITY